jgi:metal transporter CNNM
MKHQMSWGRTQEIHVDEVAMVEGALKMHTTEASEVYTPWNQVFTIPSDMILNERNAVKIYRSGFSRIPIYVKDEEDPNDNTKIVGILASRQLMVIDSQDQREVSTLPLGTPRCVSPHTSLVDLINMFQTGGIKGGHMALVCTRPEKAIEALKECSPLPEEAGLMG